MQVVLAAYAVAETIHPTPYQCKFQPAVSHCCVSDKTLVYASYTERCYHCAMLPPTAWLSQCFACVWLVQSIQLKHVLLSLVVEDSNGVGRPVAYGIISRDDHTHVEQFLNFFSENNSLEMTEVVVTDNALAEMNAVRTYWPNCRPMICHFHIMSSLNHFVRSCKFSAEDRKECIEVRPPVNVAFVTV